MAGKKKASQNQVRIIGGQWRGRKLQFAEAPGLRPTHDRVRETLFNWLAPYISGARCLDLFAGSGALGFEALSRGAEHCTLVELNRNASKMLQQNLATLKCEGGRVLNQDWQQALASLPPASIDLVFLDPPFHQDPLRQLSQGQALIRVLKPDALVYVEQESSAQIQWPATLELLKTQAPCDKELAPADVIDRMMIPMINETIRCLEEGIIATPAEADMALLYGVGFPPFRGGIFRYVDTMGLSNFIEKADSYAHLGEIYHVTEKTRDMAQSGQTFYSTYGA